MLGWCSDRIFLGSAQRKLCARGVPILTYHKIATPPAGTIDPFLYLTPASFDEQLAALRRDGYSSASLTETLPPAGNPRKRVVITFDDGCANVLQNALPQLAQHQFHAIQFLVAKFLGKQNEWDIRKGDSPEPLMDECQVREWLAAGHEIGSHTATHPNLRRLSPADARDEIFSSKKLLEDRFGLAIKHFCYPYGAWNQTVRDIVAEAGYHTACTMDFGINTASTPRFELNRIIPLSSREMLAKIRHRLAKKFSGSQK